MVNLILTPHQRKRCEKCARNALMFNHCAFCGKNFANLSKLSDHMDECEWYSKVFGE